jgi:AsmA protein
MMPRRVRLLLWSLAASMAAVLLVAIMTIYVLLQPERFTAMLQRQASRAGLELNLASPASPTLFPRPALELRGLTLNAAGANMPILLAARGQLELPWRTLFGGPTVISRLQIDAPRVDLDALQAWLASLPSGPVGAPTIPRIDAGISITRGSVVRGNQLLLSDLALETGSLVSDQPFPLTIAARDAAGKPMQLRLLATPRIRGESIQLDQVELHLTHGSALVMQLTGEASWRGGADLSATLDGKLDEADAGSYAVALKLTPANQLDPLLLDLKLDGPDNHADLHLPPLALAHWWSQLGSAEGPRLAVPPGSGHIEMAKVETAGISIEGLSLQAGDDVPAAAASAPSPATPPPPVATKKRKP